MGSTPRWSNMGLIKKIWARWKSFAPRVADFQGRLLLSLVYLVIFLPVGLIVRLFSDPLLIKKRSGWVSWKLKNNTLEEVRKQS